MPTVAESNAAANSLDADTPENHVTMSAVPGRNDAILTRASQQADPPKAVLRLVRVIREELEGLHVGLLLVQLCLSVLPIQMGGRLRVLALKMIGFQIGHGTIMAGMPTLTGDKHIYRNLVIADDCWINFGCCFDTGAPIRIGSEISIGHQVLVLTRSHHIGLPGRRASTLCAQPVNIGNGVWLGARCTILPGVTIGAGAVVAAGSVVNENVPPNMLVAGVPARVPARVVRQLN